MLGLFDAMACCQYSILVRRTPERIFHRITKTTTSRCHFFVGKAKDLAKRARETPNRSAKEATLQAQTVGSTEHVSGWHQCAKVLASFPFSPIPPKLTHKHTVALLGTHGTSAAASGRADSRQLRFVFASWKSWHCHFINYLWLLLGKRHAMNYSNAAAANLTFIQEILCKHMIVSNSYATHRLMHD